MTEVEYLKNQIRLKNIIIKKFIRLYESVDKAFAAQRLGHINQWQKVEDIIDEIDEEFDISVIKDCIKAGVIK